MKLRFLCFGEEWLGVMCPSYHITSGYRLSTWLTIGEVKVASARFLHCKVTFLLLFYSLCFGSESLSAALAEPQSTPFSIIKLIWHQTCKYTQTHLSTCTGRETNRHTDTQKQVSRKYRQTDTQMNSYPQTHTHRHKHADPGEINSFVIPVLLLGEWWID